ncbi:MAG: hypothetical protein PHY46_02375 [Candidatus Omnitrophica bacterium]|nr:hypothetical protein [Candidatus Omnitrophota bacterium]MDD5356386.1 hypothetical protein [Candidatus Omnitrophota bacterium]
MSHHTINEDRSFKHILEELREHLPYSIFSVVVGIIILGILTFSAEVFGSKDISGPSRELFHVFHPIHLLFSAAATTAMFWRYEKKVLKAIIIGFIGSVGICGISDIYIPYISGSLMGVKMHLHVCIVEHPGLIMPFVVAGLFAGLMVPDTTRKSTIFSHAAHILVSSMASIFYLISFGLTEWVHLVGLVFIYTVLAVMIPCCVSDIVFPLLLTKKSTIKK